MSARALRRLREDRDVAKTNDLGDVSEEENDDDSDEGRLVEKPKVSAFAMMEESTDDEEESDDEDAEQDAQWKTDRQAMNDAVARARNVKDNDDTDEEEEEEDIDAILAEFQDDQHLKVDDAEIETPYFAELVNGLDSRDLDFESAMRNSLLGMVPEESASISNRRGGRQAFLFGQPKDGWTRPPHFVGGGIGMVIYEQHPQLVPWPYSSLRDGELEGLKDPLRWFRFMHSDTYTNDMELYYEIQQSGDVNALASFVVDNPFIPEALLQLAKVVYQTDQSADALCLLRRALWVYECSALNSFLPHTRASCFVDCGQKENTPFFQSLFLLMQVSSIAGCMKTSMMIARYLLAMDPLRDPMSVLVVLDYFALSMNSCEHDLFVINLMQNNEIKLYYRDDECTEFIGMLADMPNWAFSYALALYRVEQSETPISTDTITAKDALVSAIRKYPGVVEEILRQNEISTTGRSTYTDWLPVLQSLRKLALPPSGQPGYDPIVYYASKSASDLIAKVFVQRSCKLWGGPDVQRWLYDASMHAVSEIPKEVYLPSPALQRYSRIDPGDYEDRFRMLPAEANPLDPALLALSLVINTNRRRILRRGDRMGNRHLDPLEVLDNRVRAAQQGIVIGGPPIHRINPDSPLLEVFWQSMLPWNGVDGVPPPGR